MASVFSSKFHYWSYGLLYHKFYRSYSLTTKSPPLNYCLNSVEKCDYENFLCTLLLPGKIRNAGIALRAFNVEVATVQDRVSEVLIGQMRYQFWEDAVESIYRGQVPDHPVCTQLAQVIKTGKVSKPYLKRLISVRKKHLISPNLFSMTDAEEYCDASNTPIYLLLLEVAEIKNVDADHASSHLGKAQGLTNMLRSMFYHSKKDKVILPQELLLKYSVSEEDVLRHNMDKNMKDVIFEMASKAYQHLEKSKSLQKKIDRTSRLILLPSVAVESYLQNLRSVDFDVFHPKLQQRNFKLSARLLWRRIF